MRLLRALVLFPAVWLVVTAADPSPSPPSQSTPSPTASQVASPSPSPSPSPIPSPSPSPIPTNAFLSLDVTQGPPTTVINVSGGQFLPNEAMTLYWDRTDKVAGSATADASGSFNTRVKPFAGDAAGPHKLCATVPPNPCATFTITAPEASPSPSPVPSEAPSPSPEQTATIIATPARISTNLSGFDVISRPPFVFLPLFGFGAILLSLAYWAVMAIRRPRRATMLPSAAVVHRATRPDYAAGFGAAPAAPAAPQQASAWGEQMPHSRPAPAFGAPPAPPASASPLTPAQPQPAPEPHPEWGPPVEWGTGTSDWGFAEPPPVDDSPEVPPPGD